ncbi:hypothetical protein [Vreelandella andesensis]|nr:hypothetical protein [Halomonas andesensis]
MSIWILPAVALVGVMAIVGFAAYITHGYDDQGEPMEQQHDHD